MTQAARSNTIEDEFGKAVSGVSVYVYNFDGSLASLTSDGTTVIANPLTSDEFGSYSYYATVGYYREDIWYGGKKRWSENNIAVGSPGSDLALRSDLSGVGGDGLVSAKRSETGASARTLQDKLRDQLSVKDFGALVDGSTDDSAAVALAASAGVFLSPKGALKTGTSPAAYGVYSFGGTFSGAAALDGPYPAFGAGVFRAIMKGGQNSLIGIAHNTLSASSTAFPVGVTGYGRNDNGGNAVFGLFGRADQYAATGAVQNEVNCFNLSSANPSTAFPVDRSIGTTQQVLTGLIVAAGGSKNSHTAVFIGGEGGSPQSFLNGIHGDATRLVNYFSVLSSGSTLLYFEKADGTVQHQGSLSVSGGVGYGTGAGAAVTQLTSKSTATPAINKMCGQVTMNNAPLASGAKVSFVVTNNLVKATDLVGVCVSGGGTANAYRASVTAIADATSFTVTIENITGGSLSEAPVINFAIIRAVAA